MQLLFAPDTAMLGIPQHMSSHQEFPVQDICIAYVSKDPHPFKRAALSANLNGPQVKRFQFGDKVWIVGDDELDHSHIIVTYDDEKFSIAKEYVG